MQFLTFLIDGFSNISILLLSLWVSHIVPATIGLKVKPSGSNSSKYSPDVALHFSLIILLL